MCACVDIHENAQFNEKKRAVQALQVETLIT